jgi:DNA-3-methyladenine glycosylase
LQPLPRAFYQRDTVEVARDLLGAHLNHVVDGVARTGRIVEVEAYLGPHDLAAHSSKGLTARNRAMFGPPGHAYIYLIYGIHFCMNIVAGIEGQGAAVLLRAIEPLSGLVGRTQGPGLLCKAMEIDRRLDGHDLVSDTLYVSNAGSDEAIRIVRRPRIGVEYAGVWAKRLLRFYIAGNAFVSRR